MSAAVRFVPNILLARDEAALAQSSGEHEAKFSLNGRALVLDIGAGGQRRSDRRSVALSAAVTVNLPTGNAESLAFGVVALFGIFDVEIERRDNAGAVALVAIGRANGTADLPAVLIMHRWLVTGGANNTATGYRFTNADTAARDIEYHIIGGD